VAGLDGELRLRNQASLGFEIAQSILLADGASGAKNGTAVQLRPAWHGNKAGIYYQFYYVQPDFYTALGAALSDRVQHFAGADYRFNDAVSVFASHNYTWDRLPGSTRAYRTLNGESNLSCVMRPFAGVSALTLRPYAIYLRRDSDDALNSADSATLTGGLAAHSMLGPQTSLRLAYEYRAFEDLGTGLNSDRAHRVSVGLSGRQMLFERPLTYTVEPSVSLRTAVRTGDRSAGLGAVLDGQYEFLDFMNLKIGYSVQDADNPAPAHDYLNNSGFVWVECVLDRQRDMRVVLGSEKRLVANLTDASRNYGETKTTLRLVSNF